jgi:hypothetical protein
MNTFASAVAMPKGIRPATSSKRPDFRAPSVRLPPGGRLLPVMITAALILAALGGIAVGTNWLNVRDDSPGSFGAAIQAPGTPSPETDMTDETLVEVPVPANLLSPDTLAVVGMAQLTIPAGTYQQSADEASGNPGVLATYIIDGTVTVVSDEAMQVIRAGSNEAPEDVPADARITLGPGDTIVTRKSPGEIWTNVGPAEVHLIAMEVYAALIATSSFPIGVRADTGNTGFWSHTVRDYEVAVILPADEPMLLRLRRVTVPTDTTLSLPADAIVQVVGPAGEESLADRVEGEIRFFGGDGGNVSGYIMTLEYADGSPSSPVAKGEPHRADWQR